MKFHPPTFFDADFITSARKAGAVDTNDFLSKIGRSLFQCKTPLVFTSERAEDLADFLEDKVISHLEKLGNCEHQALFQPTGNRDLDGLCDAMMKIFPSMHSELLPTAAPPQWGMFLRGYLGKRKGQRVLVITPFDPALKLGVMELSALTHAIDGVVRENGLTVILGITTGQWEKCEELPGFTELDREGIQVGPPTAKKAELLIVEPSPMLPGLNLEEGTAVKATATSSSRERTESDAALAARGPKVLPATRKFVLDPVTKSAQTSTALAAPRVRVPEPVPAKPGNRFAVAGLAAAFVAIATIGFAFGFRANERNEGVVAATVTDGILTLTVSPEWLEENLKRVEGNLGASNGSEYSEVIVALADTPSARSVNQVEPPQGLIPVSGRDTKR